MTIPARSRSPYPRPLPKTAQKESLNNLLSLRLEDNFFSGITILVQTEAGNQIVDFTVARVPMSKDLRGYDPLAIEPEARIE